MELVLRKLAKLEKKIDHLTEFVKKNKQKCDENFCVQGC